MLCQCPYIDIQGLSMHMSLLLALEWFDSSVPDTHVPFECRYDKLQTTGTQQLEIPSRFARMMLSTVLTPQH